MADRTATDLSTDDPVDVDALMRDLRRRVAEKKARGLYATDALARDAMESSPDEAIGEDALEELQSRAVLRQHMVVGSSTRPVVGKAVEKAKGFVVRAAFDNVADITAQQTRFNAEMVRIVKGLSREVELLRAQLNRIAPTYEDASAFAPQDAAVARLLADRDGVRLVADERGVAALAETPDDVLTAVGVAAGILATDAGSLEGLARELARVVAPGGVVAVAPGLAGGVAVAALLRAVGFARADARSSSPDDGPTAGAEIVVAER